MPIVAMAEDVKTVPEDEPGAPFPAGKRDQELIDLANVKLGRGGRMKIGVLTAAGVLFLSLFFLVKLNPDRRFGGEADAPRLVGVADVVKGSLDEDAHIVVDAEPLMSHAIRTATQKGNIGMRVVPARGAGEKLWLVLPGDGWSDPNTAGYAGRLRKLENLPFAKSIEVFLAAHPRPLFAPAAAVRTGFGSGKVKTVAGDEISVRDGDRVAFDIVDPGAAAIVCTFNDKRPSTAACAKTLADAGIVTTGTPIEGREQARFTVSTPDAVATTRTKLQTAQLGAVDVDIVTTHYESTWGKLKASAPTAFTVDAVTVPDAQLGLIGLYVGRSIPDGAYALIAGEKPQDYWYVLPVTILVGLIALLFAWALVRAVKRDLLPARA